MATLMITTLVGALAAALVFVVVTESRVGMNHQSSLVLRYSAVAAMERVIGELRRLVNWQVVPSSVSSAIEFNDGRAVATLADGTSLDLARRTADRQTASDAFYPAGANRPVWTLYAHAPMALLTGRNPDAAYLIAWVADDIDDADGDPRRDSNDVVMVRVEAFGLRGGWRAIEATLARSPVRDAAGEIVMSKVAVIAWREAR
jgi:hypothetical protein